jgi:uncharacterized coiled-coil protein SlyX
VSNNLFTEKDADYIWHYDDGVNKPPVPMISIDKANLAFNARMNALESFVAAGDSQIAALTSQCAENARLRDAPKRPVKALMKLTLLIFSLWYFYNDEPLTAIYVMVLILITEDAYPD